MEDAKQAGLVRFAYHFLHPNEDGEAQAALFLRTLGADLGEIVAALDWEIKGGVSRNDQLAQADAWYKTVDQAYMAAGFNAKPFAYSFSSFFADQKLPAHYAERPLWLAGYVREDRLKVPAPWKKFDVWQYAGDSLSPPVHGIDNRIKKDFNKFKGNLANFVKVYGRASIS